MRRLLLACVMAGAALWAFAEGTVSESEVTLGNPNKRTLTWICASNNYLSASVTRMCGEIKRITFSNSAGVSNDYDVTWLDSNDVDLLAGQGANITNAAASTICPGVGLKDGTTTSVIPMTLNGTSTLMITNCGHVVTGAVEILYQP